MGTSTYTHFSYTGYVKLFSETAKHCTLREVYLGSSLVDLGHIKFLSLVVIWNFNKRTGLPLTGVRIWGTKGHF